MPPRMPNSEITSQQNDKTPAPKPAPSKPSSNDPARPVGADSSTRGRANVKREIRGLLGNSAEHSVSRRNPDALLVKIGRIRPNPNQPRRQFDPQAEEELAADVEHRGVLEPLLVRPVDEDDEGILYEIIAGERRFRAARRAGLVEVPVIVRPLDDRETALTALVENLQRTDLLPQDEANFYQELKNRFNLSNRAIAGLINKSESYVSKRLNQLNAPLATDEEDEPGVSRETSQEESYENHNTSHRETLSKKSQRGGGLTGSNSRPAHLTLSKNLARLGLLSDATSTAFNQTPPSPHEARTLLEIISRAEEQLAKLRQQLEQLDFDK